MAPRKNQTCESATIAQFLGDQLSGDEQEAFAQHLSGCDHCRAELENAAAEAHWWQEASEYLVESDEGQQGQPSRLAERATVDFANTTDGPEHVSGATLEFLAPTDDPRMLGRLGPYEITGVIGYGGMGIVLKGLDAALNRYVAIKVLAPQLATSGAARRRFAREAQAAAAVVHENVIAIHGVAEAGGLPYLVMPYVRGSSLEKRLRQHGPLSVCEILRIGMQTALGLSAAHAQGLVHRDIKPANILLADGVERVTLTDFGLARAVDDATLTRSGVIAGTPEFMSPEQARGDAVDHRSDLFSFGSVLYAMCTGRPPFRADSSYAILHRICHTEPHPIRELNPEIPDWLAGMVVKLHAKEPAQRFASASELAELFERCLAHVQQPTVAALPRQVRSLRGRRSERASLWTRWRMLALGICIVVALAVGGAVVPFAIQNPPPSATSDETDAAGGSRKDLTQGLATESLPATDDNDQPAASDDDRSAVWDDGLQRELDDVSREILQLEESW